MVLPLTDEDRPKCCICHAGFDSMEDLRQHQYDIHPGFMDKAPEMKREPVQGDASLF